MVRALCCLAIVGGLLPSFSVWCDPPDKPNLSSFEGSRKQFASQARFRENKGQIRDQNGKERNDLRFLLSQPGMNVQFRKGGISYDVYQVSEARPSTASMSVKEDTGGARYTFHRVDVEFLGCNTNVEIQGEDIFPDYENYYVGDGGLKRYEFVRSYKKVVYRNIYANIDFVFSVPILAHSNERFGLKFDIVVHPFGNVNDIAFLYSGDNGLELDEPHNRLKIKTSLSLLEESIPVSTLRSMDGERLVSVKYALNAKVLRFHTVFFESGVTLVIDPLLTWATYYGGSRNDRFYGVYATDSIIYACGSTESKDVIATDGTHQSTYLGNGDVMLVAVNASGLRKWGTYFGGKKYWGPKEINPNLDVAYDLTIAPSNHIVIVGFTGADRDLATEGAFQVQGGGNRDGFIASFSKEGFLNWSTFYGGIWQDELYSVTATSKLIVVAGGNVGSEGLSTPDAFHTQFGNRAEEDGIIAAFDTTGQRIWATYFGGVSLDRCNSVAALGDSIVVVGHTRSYAEIATPDAYKTLCSGETDGYIAMFNDTGNILWSTYYGSDSIDIFQDVAVLERSRIAVTGKSNSLDSIATQGVHQTDLGGKYDGIVAEFSPSGDCLWGSYFGGESHETGYGITFKDSSIIICGETYSESLSITRCSFSEHLHSGPDMYLAEFSPRGELSWSSYYGGPKQDLAYDVASNSTKVFFVGETSSPTDISTLGSHQPALNDSIDGFIGCIDSIATVKTELSIKAWPDTTVCQGEFVPLNIHIPCDITPVTISWSPSSGLSDSTIADPIAVVQRDMQYVVTVTDSANITRTDTIRLNTYPGMTLDIGSDTALCKGGQLTIGAIQQGGTPPFTYSWSPSNGVSDPTFAYSTAWPSTETTYQLTVTDKNGCSVTDDKTVRVMNVHAGGPYTFCSGVPLQLSGSAHSGTPPYQYLWSPATGLSDPSAPNPTLMLQSPILFRLRVMDAMGCVDEDSVFITVNPLLSIEAGSAPIICPRENVTIGDTATGGTPRYIYRWEPETGLNDPNIVQPTASPDTTTLYIVTATDAKGCSVRDSVLIEVYAAPEILLPDAITYCSSNPVTLPASIDKGTPPFAYSWSPASGLSATDILNPLANPAVTTLYTLAVTGSEGCVSRDSILVVVASSPITEITGPSSLCQGDTAVLDAGSGYAQYEWVLPDNSVAHAQTVMTTQAGAYTVEVTDSIGCTGISSPHILTVYSPPPQPAITFRNDTLFADAGFDSYQWFENGIEIPGAVDHYLSALHEGNYIVRIKDGNGCFTKSAPYVFALASATLSMANIEAWPGERVVLPLNMPAANMDRTQTTGLTTTLRLNRRILFPVGATPSGFIENDDRIITFDASMPKSGERITELEFLALLSDIESTPLHIEKVEWHGSGVRTTTVDGEFRLKLCREGGVRLFYGSGSVAIHGNSPNPFNASTIIEYEIIEAGHTRMTVTDALGRTVSTLVDADIEPGIYRIEFNASSLSSGVYYVALQTPTVTRVRAVQVAK